MTSKSGGAKTTENGLSYEELTNLKTEYTIIKSKKYYDKIKFNEDEGVFKMVSKQKLFKCMDAHIDKTIKTAHGCKCPDECFIDNVNNRIFILEKKFQKVGGSVCEKIQTPDFKLWQYRRTFPSYDIIYIYCLSEWFRNNCPAELEYLEYKNIPFFWGNDPGYKAKIVAFIVNYQSKT